MVRKVADEIVVRKDQVWADNDKRAKGRTVQVVSVTESFAYCRVLTDRVGCTQATVGRTFRISKDRMRPTSTGYRLIKDAS